MAFATLQIFYLHVSLNPDELIWKPKLIAFSDADFREHISTIFANSIANASIGKHSVESMGSRKSIVY